MEPLNDLEQDALKELFNIGIGRSAAALNQMVSETVELSIPQVSLLDSQASIAQLNRSSAEGRVSAVCQSFSGEFSGKAVLMFTQDNGLLLVRKLLGEDVPVETLSDLEQDSLVEVGNIILNACFGTVINMLKANIRLEMPWFEQGTVEEVLPEFQSQSWSLYVEVRFLLPGDHIEGHLSFLMDIESLSVFQTSVKRFVSGYYAA